MKTTTLPVSAPSWFIIDAKEQVIGKVAVKAATILRGKHKVSFSPHQPGDIVVVINTNHLHIPPKKGMRKTYHRHTGFPGNMRHTRLDAQLIKDSRKVIELAVKGMLPDNRLARKLLTRLHVFAESQHPYDAQKPSPLTLA